MARIIGIDYGTKRTGIAVTDPSQIIASGLEAVSTDEIIPFIKKYREEEEVEAIVVGEPRHPDGNPTKITHLVVGLIRQLKKEFPELEIIAVDESFSSVDAKDIILQSGARKKKRRDKGLVDKISAVVILNNYLESQR